MAEDTLNFKIEEDGTITTESPNMISPANHKSADSFLRLLDELTGTVGQRKKLKNAQTHTHGGQHQHEWQ
jgi:hypothetical protein